MSTSHILKADLDPCSPSPDEVRGYLRALLAGGEFNTSERNRRFLTYVVEETLQGRASRIKAYNIALAAFDRTEDFDPLTDPIVRIEASRLRRSLEHYYLTVGNADRIRIDIPKGSYAATFFYNDDVPVKAEPEPARAVGAVGQIEPHGLVAPAGRNWAALAPALVVLALIIGALATYSLLEHADLVASRSAASRIPSVVVLPFEDTSGDPSRSFIARGLTYDVATALAQVKSVMVFGPAPHLGGHPRRLEMKGDYTLVGSVQSDRHVMRIGAFLLDSETGQILRSWSFEKDLVTRDVMDVQAEVASQIVASLKGECAAGAPGDPSGESAGGLFDCWRSVFMAAK
jgi:TolB-like protein